MQEAGFSAVEAVNPLIKLVKQREELYFQLLAFVNKNIQSSSNDLDNLTIFNKFIAEINIKSNIVKNKQAAFLETFQKYSQHQPHAGDDPKEMLRLSSRLVEILQASVTKVRKSVFDDNGKAIKQFSRFKIMLHKILKRDPLIIKDFVDYILNYCSNRYTKQFLKLKKYIEKVQQGEDIWLRQLYFKHNSDVQISPDKKDQLKGKQDQKTVKKIEKKIDMSEHLSSTEEQQKKGVSMRKTMKTSTKKRQKLFSVRNKQKDNDDQGEPQPLTKQQTANKLLKFYALLEINKKQFLEDYVYDKIQQQKHREQLFNKLLQRNKDINKQINSFVRKSIAYIPNPILMESRNKSSGDERNESASSKVSLRTSFVISKRKSSFHFQTSDGEKKEKEKQEDFFEKTIKNINPRRRSSHSNNRQQEKSRKLFVVKAPMVFEEQIIPQAQITQTQWFKAPLTIKGREKKNENIRLKRKNNPNPIDNPFFPQNF